MGHMDPGTLGHQDNLKHSQNPKYISNLIYKLHHPGGGYGGVSQKMMQDDKGRLGVLEGPKRMRSDFLDKYALEFQDSGLACFSFFFFFLLFQRVLQFLKTFVLHYITYLIKYKTLLASSCGLVDNLLSICATPTRRRINMEGGTRGHFEGNKGGFKRIVTTLNGININLA